MWKSTIFLSFNYLSDLSVLAFSLFRCELAWQEVHCLFVLLLYVRFSWGRGRRWRSLFSSLCIISWINGSDWLTWNVLKVSSKFDFSFTVHSFQINCTDSEDTCNVEKQVDVTEKLSSVDTGFHYGDSGFDSDFRDMLNFEHLLIRMKTSSKTISL